MSKLKFASLTAGLLARKGEAEPSATPFAEQLLTRVGAPAVDLRPMIQNTPLRPQPTSLNPPVFGRRPAHELDHVQHEHEHDHEHIETPPPAPVPLTMPTLVPPSPFHAPALVRAVEEEHHELHHEPRCGTCPGPSADDAHKTYHVNLRMKRMRFIRLKLTAALLRKPVQEIVSEALDAWFDTVPSDVLGDCACLHSRGD